MKPKFEYFLNAVHYCIFLSQLRLNAFFDKYVELPFARMLEFFMSEKGKRRFRLNQQRSKKELDDFFCSKEAGFCIGLAHHLFGYFSSSYWLSFSFTFCGLYKFFTGEFAHGITTAILMGFPIAIGYIPIYKAVYKDDRYLNFYKKYEKEDKVWRRKWKWITVAYCVGGIIVAVLGFFTMAFLTGL